MSWVSFVCNGCVHEEFILIENICAVFDWLLLFQGEPGSALSLPKCEPGEYLTSDGKQLICVKFGKLYNTSPARVLLFLSTLLMVTMLFRLSL